MATVTAFVRTSTKKSNDKINVRFRLRDGRDVQLFHTSNIVVNYAHWDSTKQELKAKIVYDSSKRSEFNAAVAARKTLILSIYANKPITTIATSEWLDDAIERELYPDRFVPIQKSFFDIFDEFIVKSDMSDVRKRNFLVVKRKLQRYEMYTNQKLSLDSISDDTLRNFEKFVSDEHILFASKDYNSLYASIYEQMPETRMPKERGQNTINGLFKKFRTFWLWCQDNDLTRNNPFRKFPIKECVYGTPYYITIDERNALYEADLSMRPALAIQRDIFVFQCLIGCRVGDLYKLTKSNIVNGAIEYVPRKTKEGRPVTVTVPLNTLAQQILQKHADYDGKTLLPYISEQRYNDAIKDMFRLTGLTRIVTVIDTITREPKQVPICDVASSHMARRCFVGNLYKKVKDPNLVGALSGHKEGSKAFARYREIDIDIKTELVKLLE